MSWGLHIIFRATMNERPSVQHADSGAFVTLGVNVNALFFVCAIPFTLEVHSTPLGMGACTGAPAGVTGGRPHHRKTFRVSFSILLWCIPLCLSREGLACRGSVPSSAVQCHRRLCVCTHEFIRCHPHLVGHSASKKSWAV